MNGLEDQYLGHFSINRRKLPGVVNLKGPDSSLEVFSDGFIHLPEEKMRTIRGIARSGEKITICDAVGVEISGTRSYYDTTKHFLSLFPHYVAVGPRHLDNRKRVISTLSFTTSGALDLFYDIGAFGDALNRVKNIKKLMPNWAKKDTREIRHSDVFYYVDRGPIISVDAGTFRIEAFNATTHKMPSPHGIQVTNQVQISFAFKSPVTLESALNAAYEFKGFCEIVSQTKHCIRDIRLRHKSAKESESYIDLYVSHAETDSGASADFRDHLVSGGLHKQEFETVLGRWLDRQKGYGSARRRIVECVRYGNHYTIDRLVGAANAFDLLPDDATGKPELPASVREALSGLAAKTRASLDPPYRERVLDSLGRIKSANLRHKITARFNSLPKRLRKRLPEIELVIDHAVRARNYFVHGSAPKLPVEAVYRLASFFTDTLEFVFVASDLSECGWDDARWVNQADRGRFRLFLHGYQQGLSELKKADR